MPSPPIPMPTLPGTAPFFLSIPMMPALPLYSLGFSPPTTLGEFSMMVLSPMLPRFSRSLSSVKLSSAAPVSTLPVPPLLLSAWSKLLMVLSLRCRISAGLSSTLPLSPFD